MKELVYEESRWIQRLSAMGCWNEQEAENAAEGFAGKGNGSQDMAKKVIGVSKEPVQEARAGFEKPEVAMLGAGPIYNDGKMNGNRSSAVQELEDGFDSIDVSTKAASTNLVLSKTSGPALRLDIFKRVRQVRGLARQEYGKVHAAFNPLFTNAVNCQNPTQAIVFRSYRDPNQQAMMLSNLRRFAESDFATGSEQRKSKLTSLAQAFENAVTKEFEQAMEAADISSKMPKYAQVLVSLNGGHKGIAMFVERNPIFTSRHRFGDPFGTLRGIAPGEFNSVASYEFFSHLSDAFNEQISVIDQVFPPAVEVAIPLVQTIGKRILAEYVTTVLDEAHRIDVETYLKATSAICAQASAFARSLRAAVGSSDEFYEAVDKIITDVFEPHIDLYLAEELSYFKSKSDAEVSEWEKKLSAQDASMESMFMSTVNRQADKRDFLTSFKKVVMMPVNVLPTFGGKPATAKALVNGENLEVSNEPSSLKPSRSPSPSASNTNRFSVNRPGSPNPEPPTTELAAKVAILNSRLEGIRSLFSIEVALDLVHTAKSSIERAVVLLNLGGTFAADTRLQCELIFIALLQTLGARHIKAGFDQAVEHLSNYNPREAKVHTSSNVEPLVIFLELVNVGDLIQQMVDVFYEQELVGSKLTAKDDFLNPAVKEKKRFEQMLDSRVAAGLNKGIEVLMDEVEFLLASMQKPEDFNPDANTSGRDSKKAADELFDINPSETARRVVEIVERHTNMLVGSTDKNTLDVFNQEVGMRLFAAICKHLKRQRISTTGSIKLIRYVCLLKHVVLLALAPLVSFPSLVRG